MSITDKFNYLKQTKENLKEVINLVKDEDEDKLTEESTFRSYPEALRKNYIKALNEGSDFIYDSLDKVTEEGETVVLDNTAVAPMKVSLNGNITQEKINAEAGTEIVNTEISVSDTNNEKENYITLQGNTYQETIEAQAGSEVEDTELAVNDVDSSKENYITLKGNTSQETTTGKNLFTGLIKNVRLDPNNGEQFSGSTGASTDFISVNINSNISYYLSGLVDTIRSFTCAYNSNKEFLGRTSAQTVSEKALTVGSFTAGTPTGTGDIAYIRITQYIQGEGTIDIIDGAKMQLEQGSTATDYEPYTGGIPSPNPDYPQQVKVVTENNVVSLSGKNLINISQELIYTSDTYVEYENGFILDRNTNRYVGFYLPKTIEAGTYTISCKLTNDTTSGVRINIVGSSSQGINLGATGRATFTTTESKNKFYFYISNSDVDTTATLTDIQLELGSTATPYVPYSKTDYEVNLISKNLLDTNKSTTGYRINRDTGELLENSNFNASDYIEVESGETYYLQNGNPLFGACYDKNKEYISAYNSNGGNLATMPENAKYVRLTFQPVNADTVMFFKGSTATDYEPYFTPIELCKINTYKDYFYKDSNKWYVHKEINKLVFNGTETWNLLTDTNRRFYTSSNSPIAMNIEVVEGRAFGEVVSNAFLCQKGYTSDLKMFLQISKNNVNNIGFTDLNSLFEDTSSVKTWLSNNNVIIYYVLATPTETEITNTTLIEQLDALYTAQLNNEVNYINTETENLFPYINLKYNIITQMPSPEKPSEINKVTGNNVVSVSGKNLFPINNIDLTLSGIRLYTQDGSFIANGTATSNIYETNSNYKDNISFNLKKGTYTLSLNATEPHQVTLRNKTTGDMLARVNGGTTLKATFTLEEDAEVYIGFYFAKDVSFDNVEYKIQLEEGSTASEYTPYSKIDYPINLDGKNLFNMNNATYVKKYGSSYSVDGQEITVTPTTTWGNVTYSYKVENNTTYTLKMKITFEGTTQTRWWLSLGNEENDAVYNGGYIDLEDGYLIKTFTTTSKILTISFQGSTTIQPTSTLFSEIQLELGSTATDYEPYITPIELCKISNYKDYLYKNNGKWYVHKVIGKKVVTSSETLAQTDSYSKVRYFKFDKNTNDIDYNKYNNADIFYTSAKNFKNVYDYNNENMIGKISPQAENIRYWVGFPKGTTLAQAKEKLVGSILYYVLAEPVETEITSLTLIEQLNNLYTAKLNNGTNYITTETGNLLPYIDLKYNIVTQMPSPEKPSDVKVVKGENVVSVSGKNLLNVAGLSNNSQGVVSTGTSDGKVACVGTTSTNYFNVKPKSRFSLSAGTYIFSIQTAIANRLRIRLWDSSDNIIGTYNINAGNISVQFTINENAEFLMMFIDSGVATGMPINITMYPMIRLSSEIKTDFVPYSKTDYPINLGDIELCKINTYKDYFHKDSGKWYVHKEIGKYELDENSVFSQNWNTNTDYETYCMVHTLNTNFGSNAIAISNILPYVSSVYGYDKIGIYQEKNNDGRIIFRVPKTIASSVSEFQTWLASNSMIVYTLIAPTETEITNTTLIEQLEAIYKAKSVKDKTYITQTNEEIPFIIDATAIKKYEEVQ